MMEPHMIDFVELASSVENYIFIVFSFAELASSVVIEVNHVGFIASFSRWILVKVKRYSFVEIENFGFKNEFIFCLCHI